MSKMLITAIIATLYSQAALSHNDDSNGSELESLSEQLFRESEPNIFPHAKVNLQSQTSSWSRYDDASSPLLSIDESIVFKIPTIEKLRALYDNYELDSSNSENVTTEETQEENEFANAVLDTQAMQTAMQFLNKKGLVDSDRESHFKLLKKIWFGMYARTSSSNIGSSGFEHVFLNEMKYGSPIGLHNWIYYYHKENQTGTVHDIDYQGYMRNQLLGNKRQIIKYRFSFKDITKPVNSMFVGTLLS